MTGDDRSGTGTGCMVDRETPGEVPRFRHPSGSLPWLREAGLGIVLAMLVVQLLGGVCLHVMVHGPLASQVGADRLAAMFHLHQRTGFLLILMVPLLVLGHPRPKDPRPGTDPGATGGSCHDRRPLVRVLGFVGVFSLAGVLTTGGSMVLAPRLGWPIPATIVSWHRTGALVLGLVVSIHVFLAWRMRRRRWRKRARQGDPRWPRFRGGWWPAAILTLVALAIGVTAGLLGPWS